MYHTLLASKWLYTGLSMNYLSSTKTHPLLNVEGDYKSKNQNIDKAMVLITTLTFGIDFYGYLKYLKVYKVALGQESFKNYATCT